MSGQFQEMEIETRERMEKFAQDFVTVCICQSQCFHKVSFLDVRETFELYSEMGDEQRAISVGALLGDMKVTDT